MKFLKLGWLSRYSDYAIGWKVQEIKSRWGARYSAPVQTGPGAHPASCTTGTGSFPGVKRSGRGVDHPPPSSAEVKERVEIYCYLWTFVACSSESFTFTFMLESPYIVVVWFA